MKTVLKIADRPAAELVASSLFLLKRLGMTAKQRSMTEYERLGLNPYHHAILALLEGSAPETQAEIADALGYDRGTMVGLLDELEEQKLVERKRDPGRSPPATRPDHSRRQAHAREAPCAVEAAGGRVPRAARHRAA